MSSAHKHVDHNTINNENDYDDEQDYYLAPHRQRAFGAGIKRKRVTFVPASTDADTNTNTNNITPGAKPSNAGSRYLAIVLGREEVSKPSSATTSTSGSDTTTTSTSTSTSTDSKEPNNPETTCCPICSDLLPPHLPPQIHESSLTHQLALQHSHPPSHLDRHRKGLKYLTEYGWDPDARVGLGARNEGIRVPIKAREKRDTAGLGLFADYNEDNGDDDGGVLEGKYGIKSKTRMKSQEQQEPMCKFNLKQTRKMEEEKKRKAEKLRRAFYGEDLSQYLGPGG